MHDYGKLVYNMPITPQIIKQPACQLKRWECDFSCSLVLVRNKGMKIHEIALVLLQWALQKACTPIVLFKFGILK